MIKILHIHTLPVISGSGINTFLTMRGMDREVFEAELACAPDGRLIDLVQDNHMKVRTFRNMVQPLHPLKDLSVLINLTMFLKKNFYHIVHTHNSKAGFIGRLAARLSGVPVIIHTVHGFSFHGMEPFWRQGLFRNMERLASHWVDKMIFISQPLIDWALKDRIACREKIIRIYSGIETERFKPVTMDERNRIRKKWKIGQEDAVIGIVSKLWEGKGHEILIEAFKEVKKEIRDARLIIVGEGYLYDSLVNLVRVNGLNDSVIFTRFRMDVAEIISTFDVAVLPSFFEGMGRVLLEAMSMEKPVIGSRVGGIPDLVEHGVNGLLVSPGNVRELTDSIKKILYNKRLAIQMGKEGKKMVTDKFSAEAMVRSVQKVYEECLTEKGIKF